MCPSRLLRLMKQKMDLIPMEIQFHGDNYSRAPKQTDSSTTPSFVPFHLWLAYLAAWSVGTQQS